MNRILLFCALGVLLGCRPTAEPSGEVITLSYSTSSESKTDALTAGDEVAVFARIEGTEHYFLEAQKFITGSDGHTLNTSPTVYYPETKQAMNFYAYFPYHTGTFSVPNDQSTAAALKKADLCWASAKSTPVSVVPLEFRHLFARLIVTANQTPSKISCLVAPSGVLNAATAEFVLNSTKSEVFTTSNELILPVQPLTRLVLTVSGVEYVFEGSIHLQSGQMTTINLTLNPSTQTATLSGSSTTDWLASSQSGTPTQAVSNVFTLHWPNYLPQGATPDKIVLTIGGTDYTVSSGIAYANKTFTVPFASNQLRYPYTISKITFYNGSTQALPSCTQLLGPIVYKSATQTLGIKDPANAIKIGNLWWATGNLIADGPNGCRIGAPTDYGLYYQFGSLVGWSGGANGDGTGQGSPLLAIKVRPIGYMGSISWPAGYWSVGSGGQTVTQKVSDNPATGIGDPCRYYLKGTWRLATAVELASITGKTGSSWIAWTTAGVTGRWATSSQTFGGVSGPGGWLGPGLNANGGTPNALTNVFFSLSGFRNYSNAIFSRVGEGGTCWSGSVYSTGYGLYTEVHESLGLLPQCYVSLAFGFPVRCVNETN